MNTKISDLEYLEQLKRSACTKANQFYNNKGLTFVQIPLFPLLILKPSNKTVIDPHMCTYFELNLRYNPETDSNIWFIKVPIQVKNNPKLYKL